MLKNRIARPGKSANDAKHQDYSGWKSAGVKEAHVLGQIEPGGAPCRIPKWTLRRPIVRVVPHRAKEVGEHELQKMHGVQRAGGSGRVVNFGAIGARREQRSKKNRHSGHDGRSQSRCTQRLQAGAHASERAAAHHPIRHNETRNHIKRQQRNLIASNSQQSDNQTSHKSHPP